MLFPAFEQVPHKHRAKNGRPHSITFGIQMDAIPPENIASGLSLAGQQGRGNIYKLVAIKPTEIRRKLLSSTILEPFLALFLLSFIIHNLLLGLRPCHNFATLTAYNGI